MAETCETIIIGGSGFIGSHLCVHLHKQGVPALSVSRTANAELFAKKASSVTHLSLFDFKRDEERYLAAAKTVIYLASTSVPASNILTPWVEHADNIVPAFELFSRMTMVNPYIRLVYVSSGGTVYGNHHTQPIHETAALEPISPYGYGKLATEEAIRFLGRTRGLSYAILRVSNPVGRWQRKPMQGIVNVALRALERDEALTLFDGGQQVRDFVDADDVARAILSASKPLDRLYNTWNIGSGQETKIIDVVHMIEELAGKNVRKVFAERRTTDVSYSVLDCTRALNTLPWSAKTTLVDTLRKILWDSN